MPRLEIPEGPIPEHMEILDGFFKKRTSEGTTPQEFSDIIENLKHNPVVARILFLGNDERQEKVKKLAYARAIMDITLLEEIGEEAIIAPEMTFDEIYSRTKGE